MPLAASPDNPELKSLYQAAGLSLDNEIAPLNRTPRVSADPAAIARVSRFLTFTGRLRVPVRTLHSFGRLPAEQRSQSGRSDNHLELPEE